MPFARMATGICKSLALVSGLVFLAACGDVNDVQTSATTGGAGSSGSGSTVAGSAGTGGSPAAGGSAAVAGGGAGGSSAGAAVGGAAVGGAAAGSGGAPGGAAGQAASGSGGVAGGAGAGGAAGVAGAAGMGGGGGTAPFVLTSPAFTHVEACTAANHTPCMLFPLKNEMTAIGGQNISPELDWGAGPAGTLSYVITLHDFSNNFTHWAIWNIPAATLKLPEMLARDAMPAVPAGAQQISFNKINNQPDPGYMGPGAKDHVYEFRLYALKVATFTPQTATDQGKIYDELEADAAKIVLGKSMLRGRSTPN
ncbi:MAG TPA: YbhB/YbcL family Raf kinase inhibitor-like protein [Polyangiaceae bacterium]|nr:YbhB/YbcL family Raf kinase inhibitor-like protein [Polyangiaceae bacterium]